MRSFFKKIVLLALSTVIFSVSLVSCAQSRGTAWHYGAEEPSEAVPAAIGDFYMKTDSQDVYVLSEEGWRVITNLSGKDGKDGTNGIDGTNGTDGSNWLYGNAAPTVADGADGDFWLDTLTLKMYKKTSGAWSEIADLNR